MNTLTIIKSIIPVLANIQGAGCFSNPLVITSQGWVESLATAANSEAIDLTEVLNAIEKMGNTTDFHDQQDEIATVLAMLDQLLEDIPAGKVPEYVAPPEGFRTIKLRLTTELNKAVEVFRPTKIQIEKMRKDAAEFVALSMGEESLDEGSKMIPHVIYDLIDSSMDCDEFEIRSKMIAARNQMERIAV